MAETDVTGVSGTGPVSAPETPGGRVRTNKSPDAFRTISEAADELGLQQHVLRFWESKFPQVKPLKRGGGRRYYRPEDIALLTRIRDWLHVEGYTIKGVQKLLRDPSQRQASPVGETPAATEATPVQTAPAMTETSTKSSADIELAIERLSAIRTSLLRAIGD